MTVLFNVCTTGPVVQALRLWLGAEQVGLNPGPFLIENANLLPSTGEEGASPILLFQLPGLIIGLLWPEHICAD